MNREVHVRFCKSVGVKFPRAARPLIHTLLKFNLAQDMVACQREEKKPPLTEDAKASEGGAVK